MLNIIWPTYPLLLEQEAMRVGERGELATHDLDWRLLKKSLFSMSYLEFTDNEILPSSLYEGMKYKAVFSMAKPHRRVPG